jgi:HD-GYP domain-containing protein (c-di-GMP phosphodiesterase class II)
MNAFNRLSLSSRFALLFAGALAVTAFVLYALFSVLSNRQSEHQAQKTVQLAGQVMSRLLKTQSGAIQAQCDFIIMQEGFGQLATVADRSTIDDFLKEKLRALRVDAAVMTGRQGQVLGGEGKLLAETIAHVSLTANKHWSGIIIAEGKPRLVVASPIQDPASQELQGMLLVYRNLDVTMAQDLAKTLDAQVSFVLDNQTIATSALQGKGVGADHVHSRAALPDDTTSGKLALQVSLPRQQLLASFERERSLILLGFLGVFALGLFQAVRLARHLTQPLEEVIVAAQEVEAGSWPKPLTVSKQREMGILQTVFNNMTETLRTNEFITVQTLAAAVDARDAYTRGHSDRVADYARQLAVKMRLSAEMVERIYVIGTLHDVGKIAIPDTILLKPGALSSEEWEIMQSHAVRSEELIRNVPTLAPTLPGIRHHHERWDGKGYPDGIAGETIPLEARILALADTFDALTSDRPYRKGWPLDRALAEIDRCSGAQFDPALVPYFLDIWPAEAQKIQAQEIDLRIEQRKAA